MNEDNDITKKFYARFLEHFLGDLVKMDVASIGIAVKTTDGSVTTGYCEADAFDKAMFAHLFQSDAMWDELEANAGLIREMVEDAEDDDREDDPEED